MSDPNKFKLNTPVVEANTDTGSGGFDVDGQLYAYDVGLPDAEGGVKGTHSKGQIDVDQTDKDLPKPTKITLAQYLGDLTSGKRGSAYGVPNTYPVDGTPQDDVSTKDEKGYPSSPSPTKNTTSFTTEIPNYYTDSYPTINEKIKKGKSDRQIPGGNELLPGVKGPTKRIVENYTSDVLKRNRFTPETAEQRKFPGADVIDPIPLRHKMSLGSSEGGKEISQAQLAHVGPLLTMRAGLELTSTDDGTNPTGTAASAGALAPGTAQLAIRKVERQLLEARDIIDNITNEGTTNYVDISSDSWGTLNNTEDQFTGISALGMVALSTAMVAALQVAIEGLSLIFDLIKSDPKKPSVDGVGRYSPGMYYGRKPAASGNLMDSVSAIAELDFGALLGINPTIYPFGDALKTGSRAFFGIEDSSIGDAFKSFISRQFDAPGHNAIIARTIVRSGQTIVNAIGNIDGNPIDIAKQLLEMIEIIRSSKIIAACNIFAQLGDAILTMDKTELDPARPGFFISKIDSFPDESPGASIQKNRLVGTLKLAYAGDRAYSAMLAPGNLAMASILATSLGSFEIAPSRPKSNTQFAEGDLSPGRFSAETVAAFEQRLDAEYVPFYFHDLRTNEIISFHAFLSSLSDDYTAGYETSDGIGRVDPVMIYKNTKRKIGLSFHIAAMDANDFDIMWAKINKLVTLVYPQYTQGKLLINESKDHVFEQPFSQLIGASPMIRIRLGDLIKGNYSRFNLARLFGLGRSEFKLEGASANLESETGKAAAVSDAIKKNLDSFSGDFYSPAAGRYQMHVEPSSGPAIGAATPPEHDVSFTPNKGYFVVKVKEKVVPAEGDTGPSKYVCEVKLNLDDPIVAQNSPALKKQFKSVLGGLYCFPESSLSPTLKTLQKVIGEVYGFSGEDYVSKLSNFMSPENNAIAKSFKATGGKGLAGFIESMNFDWYDKVTWETDPGKIAPKMCKVTIAFSPIHDISPGLDAFGMNRAPVYPVGPMGPMKPDIGE